MYSFGNTFESELKHHLWRLFLSSESVEYWLCTALQADSDFVFYEKFFVDMGVSISVAKRFKVHMHRSRSSQTMMLFHKTIRLFNNVLHRKSHRETVLDRMIFVATKA